MTRDQAEATGIAEPVVDYPYGGCALSQLVGSPGDATHPEPGPGSGIVYVSSTLGVAAIEAYAGIETPEGIGIGSPMSAVTTAYPDWDPPSEYLMRGYAPVPGNDELQYRIAFDDARTVSGVTLQFVDQDCYE
jgi:hypothetical protein